MKTSLYQLLGIQPDASPAEIDVAFRQAAAELSSAVYRGDPEAVNRIRMLRDGYAVLTDAEQRARYDQKLLAEDTPLQLTILIDEGKWRRQRKTFTLLVLLIVTIGGAMAYNRLSVKMDEESVRHREAVVKQLEKREKNTDVIQYRDSANAPEGGESKP